MLPLVILQMGMFNYYRNYTNDCCSDNITCIDGTCFGLTYCDYISRSITSCDNECGTHTEQTNEVPMRYEGACNPDNLDDDNLCSAQNALILRVDIPSINCVKVER